MQTFLSELNLYDSVQVLDNVRLQKQFLEGWQILDAIGKTPEGGRQKVNGKYVFAANHPATNMWRGHEYALSGYLALCEAVLDDRGIKTDVVSAKITRTMQEHGWNTGPSRMAGFPDWYNNPEQRERVLATHRYNLYHKDPEHYARYKVAGKMLDNAVLSLVCCPDKVAKGKHAPYYYPTH